MGRLDDLVAVVTGASGGIGRAIAVALAGEGADVVVNYARSRDGAETVAGQISAQRRRAIVVQADVSRCQDVDRLVDESLAEFGRIDIWVNNAGADILTGGAREWPAEARWDRVITVDLKGTWLCSRAAAEAMMKRWRRTEETSTTSASSSIVNISWDHVAQGRGDPTAAIYAAAKGGVQALSRCLAREFAPQVRVNVVAPGWIKTKYAEGLEADKQDTIARATPLGRWGTPDDVASAVVFLASPESAFITGETILVGGGVVMG
jgi:3-oxoacyl-[acyl-carrier protein] reductase